MSPERLFDLDLQDHMTIGIGTNDEIAVCDHLARAAGFVVLQVEAGRVVNRAVRRREQNECGHHQTFTDLLAGCDVVLCGGIGQGAFTSLTAHGIRPVVLAAPASIDEAVSRFLAGTLEVTDARVCLCGPDKN